MTTAEKLALIAENQQKVYEAGKAAGGGDNDFWLNNLSYRANHDYLFYRFPLEAFYPNANLVFKPQSSRAFYFFAADDKTGSVDLVARLKECGVTMDFSQVTQMDYGFGGSNVTALPVIDFTSLKTASLIFNNCTKLVTIEGMIFSGATTFDRPFNNCNILEKLIVSGTIGQDGFNTQHCKKLNKASITSIFNTLSTSTSGLSITLSKTSVNNAFGINVDDATTYPEGSEYYNLRHSKDNWTINYI